MNEMKSLKKWRRNPEGVERRRVGIVARLPKAVRDVINQMIDDGKKYGDIAIRVKELGHEVNKDHLVSWRYGGHQDWLRGRERLAEMQLIREFAQEIVRENKGKEVQEAAIEIATSQIYQMLMDFDPVILRQRLGRNPADYMRMLMALARLSDGGLKYERYRAEVQEKKEKMHEVLKSEEGGLSDETIAKLEEILERM
jgi:Bacteriophage Mu, Gp27